MQIILLEKIVNLGALGDVVKVKVVEADEKGRVRLSMKALIDAPAAEAAE